VISHRAGEARKTFDDVELIHGVSWLTPPAERAGVSQHPGPPGEKIGIEGKDDVGALQRRK
jgi:hypothetical protein